MALNGGLHISGQDITFLAPLTISTAINATVTTPVKRLSGANYLCVEAEFLYGSGGTTADAYIQTSLDNGLSWIDIMNFHFTTAAANKVSAVVATTALAAAVAPTDGSLTANTILSGLFGSQYRLKYVTTGTYAGATSLAVYGVIQNI